MTRPLNARPVTSIDIALRLITAEPVRLAKPLFWQAAVDRLADRFRRAADPAVCAVGYEEYARQVIFDRVCAGDLTAFVETHGAYRALSQDVWSGLASEFVDRLKLRNTGLLVLYRSLLPSCAAARRFDGHPLILDDNKLSTTLRLAPSSLAELRRVGKAVVGEAVDAGRRLTKTEFRDLVRARGIQASDRSIFSVWPEVAPPRWRTGGRRRGTS
jgi:hypothetical protein